MPVKMEKYYSLLGLPLVKEFGRVVKLVGLTIESIGPNASLNDLCLIYSGDRSEGIYAEVVGFRDDRMLLMPYGSVEGIGVGSLVESTGAPFRIPVGETMLGMVLNGLGQPLNPALRYESQKTYPAEAMPPDPMTRKIIPEVLP